MVTLTARVQSAPTRSESNPQGNREKVNTARIRKTSMLILSSLFLQFLLGMWTNLFASFPTPLPKINPLDSVFTNGPYILAAHIITGLALGILSIIVLVLSVVSRSRRSITISALGLGSILLAGESGIEFVLGWYSDDLLSFSMAVGFALSFSIYFLLFIQSSHN